MFSCLPAGVPTSAAPRMSNNNHHGGQSGGSNFKRTNTVDTATIKENTPGRGSGTPTRPSTAGTVTPNKSSGIDSSGRKTKRFKLLNWIVT